MRLTIRTNLAMRVLMTCATNDSQTIKRSEIAEVTGASENHLAQVVHALGKLGLIKTLRGRGGGIKLGFAAHEIGIGRVIRTFESDLPFAECFDGAANACPLACACRLKGVFAEALEAFYSVLDKVTLEDLIRENTELDGLLAIGAPASSMASCDKRRLI